MTIGKAFVLKTKLRNLDVINQFEIILNIFVTMFTPFMVMIPTLFNRLALLKTKV